MENERRIERRCAQGGFLVRMNGCTVRTTKVGTDIRHGRIRIRGSRGGGGGSEVAVVSIVRQKIQEIDDDEWN